MPDYDVILKNGYVIDPLNDLEEYRDIGIVNGSIAAVERDLPTDRARQIIDVTGKMCMPGIIDTHVHVTGPWCAYGHVMMAKAGVTTALDCQGPVQQIIGDLERYGAGLNIAVLEEMSGDTMSSVNPSETEINAYLDKALAQGALGPKILGGHFPLSPDASHEILKQANRRKAYTGWHAGSTKAKSNLDGLKESLDIADGYSMQLVHINAYCRGTTMGDAAQETIEAMKFLEGARKKGIVTESHIGPYNGTSGQCVDGLPLSHVTRMNLEMGGYASTEEGLENAIRDEYCLVNMLFGDEVGYASPEEGFRHWEQHKMEYVMVSFPVNKRDTAYLCATHKDSQGQFTVDALSTDGGGIPRNFLISKGLLLVKFNALSLKEYVMKTSTVPARMLGLHQKGHFTVGADADITIFDYERERPETTIVAGKVIMTNGIVFGQRGKMIITEAGEKHLKSMGVPYEVVNLDLALMYSKE